LCPQEHLFLHKNIKTNLSRPKKSTLGGLASVEHCSGAETYLDTEKKKFLSCHSILFPHHVGFLVGCCVGCYVVVMLLLLSSLTLLPRCQRRTAALGTPPPSVGVVDDACWYDARMGGSKSNAVNLILRLFLYHILHTMSL
jgi:hypothetical protein